MVLRRPELPTPSATDVRCGPRNSLKMRRTKTESINPPKLVFVRRGNRHLIRHLDTRSEQSDLDEARHAADTEGALFRPVSNNRTGELDNTITPDGVYKLARRYALALGLKIGALVLRATVATNAPLLG
jgi:hypothetical protein